MGSAVSNTSAAYAELAAVSAELAVLEQQQKAQMYLDDQVSGIDPTRAHLVRAVAKSTWARLRAYDHPPTAPTPDREGEGATGRDQRQRAGERAGDCRQRAGGSQEDFGLDHIWHQERTRQDTGGRAGAARRRSA